MGTKPGLAGICSRNCLAVGGLVGAASLVVNWLIPGFTDYLSAQDISLGETAMFSLEQLSWSALYGIGAAALAVSPRLLSGAWRRSDLSRMRDCWRAVSERECSFEEAEKLVAGLRLNSFAAFFRTDFESTQDPFMLIEYAERFANQGRFDDACLALRNAFVEGADFRRPVGQRLGSALSPPLTRWNAKLKKYLFPADVGMQFAAAAGLALYDKLAAWRHSLLARSVADEVDEYKAEAYVMHAMFSSALGADSANADWESAVSVLEERPEWERCGETRRETKMLKGSGFISRSILFQGDDLESLVEEAQAISDIRDSVGNCAVLPDVFFLSDSGFVVKRFLEGETLLHYLENNDKSYVMRIVELLAKIHCRYKPDEEKLSVPFYLKSRLLSEHLGIPRDLARSVIHNYRPVYDSLKAQPHVYNKDGHPDNWVVGKHRIGIIDCERSKLIPAQFDLVNLLCYGDFFNVEEQQEYVSKYIDCVKDEGLFVGESAKEEEFRNEFMLGYWNAVIHRMIGLTSAWSSPLRRSLHVKRQDALRRAIDAIDIIEKLFPEYYALHEKSYLALKRNLGEIEARVVL